jgi:hypothetical protein
MEPEIGLVLDRIELEFHSVRRAGAPAIACLALERVTASGLFFGRGAVEVPLKVELTGEEAEELRKVLERVGARALADLRSSLAPAQSTESTEGVRPGR